MDRATWEKVKEAIKGLDAKAGVIGIFNDILLNSRDSWITINL